MQAEQNYSKTVTINALPSTVWHALVSPELMKQWMSEQEISISTDWKPGSPILVKGTGHWTYFENKGSVLQFEPEKKLTYTHLSSLSKLSDDPANYSAFQFVLQPEENRTHLTLTLSGFPTESIYKHLVFYWKTTLNLFKDFIETRKFN